MGLGGKPQFAIKFTKNGVEITEDTDFPIALPNDLLGSQAFYNIIENLIRNTAKHNQHKIENETTIFTVNFRDIELCDETHKGKEELAKTKNLYYQVEIFDSLNINKPKLLNDEEQKQYKKDTEDEEQKQNKTDTRKIISQMPEIDWIVYGQNKKLNESVLDQNKNNELRTSSLGLLEMEASAAYLRKLDIPEIEDEKYSIKYDFKIHTPEGKLNILKAINKNNCLGYSFFVSKPTEFLIVGEFELHNEELDTLVKDGIWVISESEFEIRLREKDEVFNHQFVIYKDDSTKEICENYPTNLPVRFLKWDDSLKLNNKSYSFSAIEQRIWQKWFDQINEGLFTTINVFSDEYDSERFNQDGRYNIAFLHHNEDWDKKYSEYGENLNYLEPLSSNAQKGLPNFKNRLVTYLSPLENYLTETVKIKLFEAAISKIIVIDERVQGFAEKPYVSDGLEIPNHDIFNCTNISIPKETEIDLGAKKYDDEIRGKIEDYIEGKVKDHKFLLIHYSILERMYENKTEEIDKKLNQWSEKLRLLVTSGRGKPPKLPDTKICFVHLSPVLNVFTGNRSKYAINVLLNSARK